MSREGGARRERAFFGEDDGALYRVLLGRAFCAYEDSTLLAHPPHLWGRVGWGVADR